MDSLLTSVAIDPQQHAALLSDLQGNILKSHGREHVRLVLVRFRSSTGASARRWVRAFGRGWVTAANERGQQGGSWIPGDTDTLFANLFLTAAGYAHIGVPDAQVPTGAAFRAGMRDARERIGDPAELWDGAGDPVHALVLLACAAETVLDARAAHVMRSLDPLAELRLQEGRALRRPSAQPDDGGRYVDHLNFADGLSQPLFFQADIEAARARGGIGPYDPSAPLSLVLQQEPARADGSAGGPGSYLVYRKIEQDVRGFTLRERELGAAGWPGAGDPQGGLDPADRPRVGAMVVGRFRNGTPLVLSGVDDRPDAPEGFDYAGDPNGNRCPHFAHVRKMNPRTPESRMRRIVRRGIPYEDVRRPAPPFDETQPESALPEGGVGLLFLCFQASIEDQFEALQCAANDPAVPHPGAGIDPLAGRPAGPAPAQLDWPRRWGSAETCAHAFGAYTRIKEGEYFFAPSKSFFRALAEAPVAG